ncbi:SMI1/KNR4 family protein [Allorhodopirellula solitaria]|uniref:Knr4/Smi1-like domain-containing protein n=1 Tax=Allorhodopirellula solitaria TaxID=2527987 RepID=A0A5C5X0F6_9BACT|nr:hypothetical protein CA85_45520 [Allorhodopirellula solitaria]
MVENLTQLVPPPRRPFVVPPIRGASNGFGRSWEDAEETLGISFPEDHKRVVERYGDGLWGGSLVLITPRFCNVYRNTVEIASNSHLFNPRAAPLSEDSQYLKAFHDCQRAACNIHEASPYEFYPSNPGLLPLGYIGNNYLGLNPNGCYLFWRTSEEQEAVVLSRNLSFRVFRQGLCSFLFNAFQGNVDLGVSLDISRGFESWWGSRHKNG